MNRIVQHAPLVNAVAEVKGGQVTDSPPGSESSSSRRHHRSHALNAHQALGS
jgi:hypothetical protein